MARIPNMENKKPSGLNTVLIFSTFYGIVFLIIGIVVFSFSFGTSSLLFYSPIFFIAMLAECLAGFLLIVSVIGFYMKKKIAYWSIIFAWVALMISGLYINYVIEIGTEGLIPAGPAGFIPDLIFYGVIPCAILFYMLAEKTKIENWFEITE